jgi:hypothetical protein
MISFLIKFKYEWYYNVLIIKLIIIFADFSLRGWKAAENMDPYKPLTDYGQSLLFEKTQFQSHLFLLTIQPYFPYFMKCIHTNYHNYRITNWSYNSWYPMYTNLWVILFCPESGSHHKNKENMVELSGGRDDFKIAEFNEKYDKRTTKVLLELFSNYTGSVSSACVGYLSLCFEENLYRTFHRFFLPSFDLFGQAVSEEKIKI